MYRTLRAILFKLDPETAHQLTMQSMRLLGNQPFQAILRKFYAAPQKPVQAIGLSFPNPVGLAAGYDKDGIAVHGLAALGFGHIEIGTVTPQPQPGNPRPRVFRLVEDQAVINRMGFPGKGMDFVASSLQEPKRPRKDLILGVNLGKNKDTPLEEAASDYIRLMRTFASLADYLAINISSPNTVGLRRLQGREMLEELLGEISKERTKLPVRCPMLVKLAPDLNDDELEDAVGIILEKGMDGIIATNTTLAREGLQSKHREEAGGLSGEPLGGRSEALLKNVLARVGGKIPVVSVGGIMTPEDAVRRLDMGAALIQIYTGLVYAGPGLVKAILKGL